MFKYVEICFKKYCDFNGRARRSEYWYFALFNAIINFILSIILFLTGGYSGDNLSVLSIVFYSISSIWGLITILPCLSVTVRRLHDTNRSAWYLLLYLLFGLGCIILIFMLAADGKPGTNQWGKNPKEIE